MLFGPDECNFVRTRQVLDRGESLSGEIVDSGDDGVSSRYRGLGLPRTELKAASCNANDLVLLKKRNGFSTCQTRSAAHAELAPMLTKVPTSHAIVASVLRRMKSPLAPPCR